MPSSETLPAVSEPAIPFTPLPRTGGDLTPVAIPILPDAERKGLTKKEIAADPPR